MKTKTWKPIEGYEKYFISNTGEVKSSKYKEERILKKQISTKGYYYISLSKNGIVKKQHIHRLVAKTFIPNPDNKICVNHKDGNKLNNFIDNLEWNTYSENNQHAYDNGLKTDNRKVIISKNGITLSFNSVSKAAKHIGVQSTAISRVAKGKRNTVHGWSVVYEEVV